MRYWFTLFIILGFGLAKGQSWSSFGGHQSTQIKITYKDSATGFIYVGGLFDSIYSVAARNIAYFDGVNWHPLGAGFNGLITSIVKYNNEIYAAGFFDSSGMASLSNSIAKWDGLQWSEIDASSDLFDNSLGGPRHIPYVNDLCVYGNKLFFVGSFNSSPNLHNSYAWSGIGNFDGSKIIAALSDEVSMYPYDDNLESFQGNLYLGISNFINDTCISIPVNKSVVYGLAIYDSLCKKFTSVGNWPSCAVTDLMATDTALIICSTLSSVNFGNFICAYNGNVFNILDGGFNYNAYSSIIYNNKLIVSGGFTSNFGGTINLNNIAEWDGNSWQPFQSSCHLNEIPYNLNNFDSLLISSGIFDSCGIDSVFNSVSYPSSFPVSISELNFQPQFNLYPNPATDQLTIESKYSGPVLIYDFLGQLVGAYEKTVKNLTIDVSQYSPGMYLMRTKAGSAFKFSVY